MYLITKKPTTISLLFALLMILPVCQAKNYKIATISPDTLSWMKKLREGPRLSDFLTAAGVPRLVARLLNRI